MERPEVKHKRIDLNKEIPLEMPCTVLVDPCGACNFSCCFCPCNNSDYKKEERHRIMEWEIFQKVVESLKDWKAQGSGVKVVDFHGFGEPMINPRIGDMVKQITDLHVCRETRMVSNGSMLSGKMIDSLIDGGLNLLRISLYSLSSEGYSSLCKTKVTYDQVIENISDYYNASRNTNSKISVKIISSELKNKDDEKRFYDTFSPISDYCFVEELGGVWPGFEDIEIPQNAAVKGDPHVYDLSKGRKVCTYPFTDIMIHADGAVSPCRQDWRRGLIIGNVNDESLVNIWNGKKLRNFWIKLLDYSAYEDTECKQCSRLMPDVVDDHREEILDRLNI